MNKKKLLLALFYTIVAAFLIGFSFRFEHDAVIGNSTITDWKGYVFSSFEINVLTEPNRSSHGTASLHSGVNDHYTVNDLVIPDVIRLNDKLYDLVQIDSIAFVIPTRIFVHVCQIHLPLAKIFK